MSHNTNKLFWLSALAIVIVVACMAVYNNVTTPTNTLYNNNNQESLCNALYKDKLISCLDASSNSELGQHDKTTTWYDQTSKLNGTLVNFDFNENSGWEETSLRFDGIDDKLILNTSNIKGEAISLLLNLKLEELPNSKSLLINHSNLKMYIKNNGQIELESFNGTLTSTTTLNTNAWYSIMLTYKDGTFKLFLNGQQDSKSVVINSNIKELDLTNTTEVGSSIKMYLSSFAIWNDELTDNNINQNIAALNNKILDIEKYYVSFDYIGKCQEWIAPKSGKYQIELWGAQGNSSSDIGGKGAYTSGNIDLKKDTKLFVCVGSGGNNTGTNFNGGGTGIYSGGGATDVRLAYDNNEQSFDSLKSRIMVAAGGGGAINTLGGAGGNTEGVNGIIENIAIIAPTGGKQKIGGSKALKKDSYGNEANIYTNGENGTFGKGGNSTNGAGGGAGYYGGGSISVEGSAAGGSSYISGYEGMISLHANSNSSKMIFTDEKHYSGYVFESAFVVNGESEMKNPTGEGTINGKIGNGYAKISLIKGEENIEDKTPISVEFKVPGKPEKINEYITYNRNIVKFNETSDASSYECYYGTDINNIENKASITTVKGEIQQCLINNLSQNTNYYYKIVAINGDKIAESDIYEFKTDYKTPDKAILNEFIVSDTSIDAVYTIDTISDDYICKLGTSEGNLNLTGTYTKNNDKVTCHYENLNQYSKYYISLKTINNIKSIDSNIKEITTDYAKPNQVTLANYETTTNSINANFTGLDYYSDVKCYIGESQDNITEEMNVGINGSNVNCFKENLEQGKKYYIKVNTINHIKNTESVIATIKTKYQTPEVPIFIENLRTDNSINIKYDISNNLNLPEVTYSCVAGTNENEFNIIGTITYNLDNSINCNFNGLDQNTKYFVRTTALNGDARTFTEVTDITTDYLKPVEPTYINSSVINDNNIIANYHISNVTANYSCYASLTEGQKDIIGSISIENNMLTCNISNLSGGNYYYYVYAENGPYNVSSEIKSQNIALIKPSITVTTDSSQFNTKGWAKNNITLNVQSGSKVNGQLKGVAMCKDTKSCNPDFNMTKESEGIIFTPNNTKTEILNLTDTSIGAVNTNITISTESDSNYVCLAPITNEGMGDVSCYGPYKLDKTAPVIRMAGGTVVVNNSTSSLDLYNGITIDSDLSGVNKTYTNAPTWKTNGEYIVNYTFTDNAGNITTARRAYDIISGTAIQVDTNEKVFGTGNNYYFAKFSSTVSGAHMSPRMYLNGSKISSLPTFPKAGYTLNGFYKENSYTNQVTANTNYNFGKDITLYAKTTLITYDLSYELNSGSATNPSTYNTETATFTLSNPTRNNYDFVGWSGTGLSGNNNTSVTISKGSTGDKSYTANWTPHNYSISYKLNNGTATNPTSYNVESNAFTLNNPTRSYYDFVGWSGTGLSGTGNKTVTVSKGSSGNREYTANWTPHNYSISYNYNGGSASNKTSYNIETAKFCLTNPTRAGWSFNGWSGSGSGGSVCINQGSTGNKSYTANWVDNIAPQITDMWFSEQGNAWNYNTGKHWRTTISVVEQGSGIKNIHYWGVGFNNNGEDWPNTTTAWDGFSGVTFGSSQMCAQVEDNAGNWGNQYCKVING